MKEAIFKNFFTVLFTGFLLFVAEFFIKNTMVTSSEVANSAMAFSLPVHNFIIIGLSAIIIMWLLQYFAVCCRDGLYGHVWALNVVIWGAFSNLYDRLTRGFVVDYIDIGSLPIFNLSDIMIVGGMIALLILISKQDAKLTLETSVA
jgi:signal peptidase II